MKKLLALPALVLSVLSIMAAACFAADSGTDYTAAERAFMAAHPVVRLGVDPLFVPFEFIDKDGVYKGMTADYLAIVSEKTGMTFEVVQGLTWPEAYDMALSGDVDMLPAISKTQERETHFLFTEPYYHFKRVIVTQDDETGIFGIEDLKKLTVAVQRNSSHHSYLLAYPGINLSLYDSAEAALAAVADGTERAFVGNLATSSYLIRSNGLSNLKFTAFEAQKQQALYFAVRSDWPELVGILNKVLERVTEEQKIAINNRWINFEQETDYGPVIRLVSIIGAFVAMALAVSCYWIIRLHREIGKRKRIQAALERARQEAEDANQFKSNFMARMSHEIRTPLNAIAGMAYLLKKTRVTLTQRMYADRITQASTNMLSIINDILDFSKIEAGKMDLDITSFSMDQVIQDVVNIISYKIDEQEIGFKLSKDPLIPCWFFGDPKRIEQILLNILNNAAKFTRAGEVSLDIRLVAKENEKYHLSFSVRDTGIGMSEEQVKKLFVPFTQGDVSINRRFGGTGLGLSIVKNLVEMMGGQIQVFSTVGEGSTFVVQLALSVDKEREAEYFKTLSASRFKDVRALVLEKTGASMNLIESYLGAFGIQCELTSAQASALSMLEAADGKFAKPFDLLIIDYETPLEGGFKFLESLQNSRKIFKMPKVIMLFPMMRADLFEKLNDYGVDIGIGKPIVPSVLFNGILEIFRLKAVCGAQPSAAATAGPSAAEKPWGVLVVEDNKTNQLIAKSLLKQAGITSILAGDGQAAVALFKQYRDKIDLILMDLHMPVMNGYDAAREIQKTDPDIPIVAMTADVILGVREKCTQYGIHHYISKPFEPDRFIQTVRDIISESRSGRLAGADLLDRAAGLKNMGGDTALYREVLNEYFNENQGTADKLRLTIGEKRYADAAQIVHKVKSSSGSIGARALYDLSIKLQKALDEENDGEILPLQQQFSNMLGRLLGELARL